MCCVIGKLRLLLFFVCSRLRGEYRSLALNDTKSTSNVNFDNEVKLRNRDKGKKETDQNNASAISCDSDKFSFNILLQADSQFSAHSWSIVRTDTDVEIESASYTWGNRLYDEEFCLEYGSYKLTLNSKFGVGMLLVGWVELKLNGASIERLNGPSLYSSLDFFFYACSSDSQCDDGIECTEDACNVVTKQCVYTAVFTGNCRSYGSPTVLILRVVAQDIEPTYSLESMSNYTYGTYGHAYNMKDQFANCSYGKFTFEPFSTTTITGENIDGGITEIPIPMNAIGESTSVVVDEAMSIATTRFGDLESQFDFLIMCIPPQTRIGTAVDWKAFAYINSYLSVYNDDNCVYPSILIHELGHNLGLSHSNDHENYGDYSGNMGISRSKLDGPAKCFNGPKLWQLGWFAETHLTLVPQDLSTSILEYTLIGISDYSLRTNENTIIKLINGNDGSDYYFTFNSNTNMNSGTEEGENKILVTRTDSGVYYKDSYLISRIDNNEYFGLLNHDQEESLRFRAIIDVDSSPPTATLRMYYRTTLVDFNNLCGLDEECYDLTECTLDSCVATSCVFSPQQCADCGAMVTVDVSTNDFPTEILWEIKNSNSGAVVRSSGYYGVPNASYNESKCLEYGHYTFSLTYSSKIPSSTNASFSLRIEDLTLDEAEFSLENYLDTGFSICATNEMCRDYDGCTIDNCNTETRICSNVKIENDEDCVSCTWATLEINPDNFPEETGWSIYNVDSNFNVISGDPYSISSIAFGRRKAPTKASGRRKAPTRSSSEISKLYEKYQYPVAMIGQMVPQQESKRVGLLKQGDENSIMEDNENRVFENICFEIGYKYRFIITDSFGDGMCCVEGDGSYSLTVGDISIQSGGSFENIEEMYFRFIGCNETAPCDDKNSCTTDVCFEEISTCAYYHADCSSCGLISSIKTVTGLKGLADFWELGSKAGETFLLGGPYDMPARTYESIACLPFGSYIFDIFESISILSSDTIYCVDNADECGLTLVVGDETLVTSYSVEASGPLKLEFEVVDPFPSQAPSIIPSGIISVKPSFSPSMLPSNTPSEPIASHSPSYFSSFIPSAEEISMVPSTTPSKIELTQDSNFPSKNPSNKPSALLSDNPSAASNLGSDAPSQSSNAPSAIDIYSPSDMPSNRPSILSVEEQSKAPSDSPSTSEELEGSEIPSNAPSVTLSKNPSTAQLYEPSNSPSSHSLLDDWAIDAEEFVDENGFESILNGFSLKYRISKGKAYDQFVASIFDESCLVEYTEGTIMIVNKTLEADESRPNFDRGIISLKLNQSEIEKSSLWSNTSAHTGMLSFCIRGELILDEDTQTSVSFNDAKIYINVNFEASIAEFSLGDVSLQKKNATDFEEEARFRVSACICDVNVNGFYECNESEKYATQNSNIKVCVKSESQLMITNFESVVLYQDGHAKFVAVNDGVENSLTSISALGEVGVLETRLVSAFFNHENPSPLTIRGKVIVDFINIRSLVEDNNALRETEQGHAAFVIKVLLDKSQNRTKVITNAAIFVIILLIASNLFNSKRKSYGYTRILADEN